MSQIDISKENRYFRYSEPDYDAATRELHAAMGKVQDKFRNTIYDNAKSAQGKEVAELTNDEKFAICFVSGCEIEWTDASGGLHPKTKYPCGIWKEGPYFRVLQNKKA